MELAVLAVLCLIGVFRLIYLIYVKKSGFKTKLEYVNFSHSIVETEGPSGGNAYMGGESVSHYVKAKYRTPKGLYIHKTVPQSIFSANGLESVDIILFPQNHKWFIYEKKMSQWILPMLCTVVLFTVIAWIIIAGF